MIASSLATLAAIEAYEATPYRERCNLATTYDLLARTATSHGRRDALIVVPDADIEAEPASVTYANLFARVTQAANLFHALGGGAVSILLPNLVETHVATLGAQAAGIANPINPFLEPERIIDIMRAAEARVLVVAGPGDAGGIWSKVARVAEAVPGLRAVLTVGGADGAQDFMTAAAVHDGHRLAFTPAATAETVASYFHTGGTTGAPKLAQLTHGNLVYMAWALGAGLESAPGRRIGCGLPLFHINAAIITGLSPFFHGDTVALLTSSGFRHPQVVPGFWRLVERLRLSSFSAVPTVLGALAEVPLDGADLGSLGHVVCGAAPMAPDVLRAFERNAGVPVYEGYGLTEGSCVSTGTPIGGVRKTGSVGLRLPYQPLAIMARGRDGVLGAVESGASGAVMIRGPNLFAGYDGANGGAGPEGWFDTGDLGRLDDDGYLWLTGRAKDIIIRGGHNIDPGTIEDALSEHPAVALAAAIGRPDRRLGELPVAFVALRPGAAATPDELVAFARRTMSERAAMPVAVTVLDRLPLSQVGKILKEPLRRIEAERTLSSELAAEGVAARFEEPLSLGSPPRVLVGSEADAARVLGVLDGFAARFEVVVAV